MKVRMLTTVAGLDDKGHMFIHATGEELDLPAKVAKEYLEKPYGMPRAEPVAQKRQTKAETRG